jgi:hypothetical protein
VNLPIHTAEQIPKSKTPVMYAIRQFPQTQPPGRTDIPGKIQIDFKKSDRIIFCFFYFSAKVIFEIRMASKVSELSASLVLGGLGVWLGILSVNLLGYAA